MRTAHVHLEQFNQLFTLDEREETKLKDAKSRIPLSIADLQTLGQALVKAFKTDLPAKEADQARLARLRHAVSNELSQACMNKLWEENFVTNALQDQLARKNEQLAVVEEKSTIQSNLVAVSKRRQNMAEKELARLTERNEYLSKEVEDYATSLKDQMQLRSDVV